MASLSSRGNNNQKRQQQQQSSGWWLLPLLALTALHMQSWASVEALPITSRPIEGNAQGEAWKAWLRLSDEQRTLEKPKKVMPKSIFALPFRHCPPGHKLYNERCIPQININPTDIVAQELQGQLGEHGGSQFGFTDYDYSDSESDELIYELPLGPLIQNEPITTLTSPSGAEDQALPSEDAPLKFNIFEKKFPTTPDDLVQPQSQPQPDAVNATTPAATATTVATTATTPTPTPTPTPMPSPTIATLREDHNRITSEAQDLLADASNTWPSTTSLSIPSSTSNIAAFSDIGNIDAIVVPAGVSLHSKESMVQLVTSSMSDEPNANADTNSRPTTDTDADTDTETESESEAEADAESEADLEPFLKVDAFQPADVNMMPLFSHRRIAPLLSADLDGDDVTATDIVPTEVDDQNDDNDDVATTTTATAATTPTTAILSSTQAQVPGEEQEIDESDLKKSKVQPVQLVTTAATTTTTTAATTATIASISTPTTTTTTTSETEVAAIHQDANGNKRDDDDDRFYYQHFVRNAAASGSSSSSTTTSTTTKTNNADSDLDVLNDMASSENLMTNTIGGQGDSEGKAASEINFEQELRIINELVKGKRRLSQLRQQQQQHEPPASTSSSSSSSTAIPTTTTTAIIESSSNAFSTTATSSDATTATAAAPAETTTFWSKLMPTLSQSSTAEAATTITATVETITTTPAAATLIAANVADSAIATTPTAIAPTATTAFVSTQHLSINPNRSNMNSKIIRIDSTHDYPQSTKTTTTTTTKTTPSPPPTTLDTLPTDESYTPFWWLPSIGWRLDRQVDEKGEDRSLLLRLFRTFRANDSDTTTAVTTTTTTTTAAAAAEKAATAAILP